MSGRRPFPRSLRLQLLLLGLVGAALALPTTRVAGAAPPPAPTERLWHEPPASPAASVASCPDLVGLVQRVGPAVVSLAVELREDPTDDPQMQAWFQWFRGRMRTDRGIGSGFILREDGYVLTNAHLVRQAGRITVRLADDRELPATVVGEDRRSDLALLKVEARGLPTVVLGDSDRLQVGQWVVAIGNPMGLSSTVTAGIVSALQREPSGGELEASFIQTDASINPGNSGGPLLNLRGEVVGISTAVARGRLDDDDPTQGIGFALPVNPVKRLLPRLLSEGRVRRGWLGLRLAEIERPVARALGLTRPRGALVQEVVSDSPAARAGLQPGDVVVRFDRDPVGHPAQLTRLAGLAGAGTKVELGLVRQGKPTRAKLVLGAEPGGSEEQRRPDLLPPPRSPAVALGVRVVEVPADTAVQLGLAPGQGVQVVAVEPEGVAAAAGVRIDDVLLRANRAEVQGVSEFRKLLAGLARGEVLTLLVLRDGRRIFFPLVLE